MPKSKFLFIFLSASLVFLGNEAKNKASVINTIAQNIDSDSIGSGLLVIETFCKAASFLVDKNQKLESRKKEIYKDIEILKIEEELIGCVAKNAYGKRERDCLPTNCNKTAEPLLALAGLSHHTSFISEFNSIMQELPPVSETENGGMSTTTKVVIGGCIVVGAAGIFLVCAPIALPGTLIAAKAATITGSVKAGAAAVGTKIAVASTAAKASAVAVAPVVIDGTIKICEEMRPFVPKKSEFFYTVVKDTSSLAKKRNGDFTFLCATGSRTGVSYKKAGRAASFAR